jgi:hypothetical protein
MVDGLVDQRKIATELSQRAIDRIITVSEKAIKEYWGRYKNRDVSTYADYLVRKAVQANAVRNFIYDRRSASLYDIYVPATIADPDRQYSGDDLLLKLCTPEENPRKRAARSLAIVGNAGTGKSLFLKHAFFKVQKIEANKIPVIIEVRTFNRLPLADLEASPTYARGRHISVTLVELLTFWLQSTTAGIVDRCRCGGLVGSD